MRIYFDYAATTPVDPVVERAMRPYWGQVFGNPGSVHQFGQEASATVFEARQKVAKAIGADYKEIIFTGSATEANNLALRGVIKKILELRITDYELNKNKIRNPQSVIFNPRIIISQIEHESVLETAKDLENQGLVEVVYIPVSKEGIVNVKKIKEALNERTVLVSVMYVNNEIGTIQPIFEVSKIIQDFKSEIRNPKSETNSKSKNPKIKNVLNLSNSNLDIVSDFVLRASNFPLFHIDAVQALQFLNCNVNDLGVDLMTLSAHKIYGPKGIGALYIKNQELRIRNQEFQKKRIKNNLLIPNSKFLIPVTTGGGQEFGFRSGTENVPYIVGFGKAVELLGEFSAQGGSASGGKRLSGLRDYFWKNFKKIFPKAELNGGVNDNLFNYNLPNILNIYIPGSSAHDRCIELDLLGIAVSPGVACSARSSKPSYVIEALGLGGDRASSSLRFSFGRYTTRGEMDRALKTISKLS